MLLVTDNFVENAEIVRQSALRSGFGSWRPTKGEVGSSVYDGMNFWGMHAPMIRGVCGLMGKQVYPNDMFFRVTNEDTEAAYVHSDRESGDYTAIVYLSHHEDEGSGTGFFKHRETGAIRMKSFAQMNEESESFERLKSQMVRGSADDWEMVDFIPGRFNRAVIFDAPLFHARLPKNGFGDSAESGRMVWACHFYTEVPRG